jgi:hypothetical protein
VSPQLADVSASPDCQCTVNRPRDSAGDVAIRRDDDDRNPGSERIRLELPCKLDRREVRQPTAKDDRVRSNLNCQAHTGNPFDAVRTLYPRMTNTVDRSVRSHASCSMTRIRPPSQ